MAKIRAFVLAVFLVVSTIQIASNVVDATYLQSGFYSNTCPQAEGLVYSAVRNAINSDRRTGAGIIRMLFHDCFVEAIHVSGLPLFRAGAKIIVERSSQLNFRTTSAATKGRRPYSDILLDYGRGKSGGCDASILIDSTGGNSAEKDAVPNQSLHGFEVIDAAKSAIEATCPGVVSCADILAIAARDSVTQLGGAWYDVQTGRRDGTVSSSSNVGSIPSPRDDAQTLINNFNAQGLSKEEMVTLSGAHSIGKAHCGAFSNRLYGFSDSSQTDPSLDAAYAGTLKSQCPQNFDSNTVVDLDPVTSTTLDNQYYKNLVSNKGLLTSDQTLYTSPSTQEQVIVNANSYQWQSQFGAAMQAMGRIGVKTGSEGQIRFNCRAVNSY